MIKEFIYRKLNKFITNAPYEQDEFCPRCNASLNFQKGYSNDLNYWICKGCGEQLIKPTVKVKGNIVWKCDECESYLSDQPGFSPDYDEWECLKCGFVNKIDKSEVYPSDGEYKSSQNNPYKGLSDDEVMELLDYEEIDSLNDKQNVILVKNIDDDSLYVKKYLKDYDLSVYQYLLANPVNKMPRLYKLYEGTNNLVVIEEYIEGSTLSDMIESGVLDASTSICIAKEICETLSQLHNLDIPIIHRDLKPSNIIISEEEADVYLLDMNVAKWYKPDEAQDTKLFATKNYAAPEQFGYGFSASSVKTDIYAIGVILNEMITGKLPKEVKVDGNVWKVIEKCISLEPEKRYTVNELNIELDKLIEEARNG